jgi:hypothetical protein
MSLQERYRKWFVLGVALGAIVSSWGFASHRPNGFWVSILAFSLLSVYVPLLTNFGLGVGGYVTRRCDLVFGEKPIPQEAFLVGLSISAATISAITLMA